MKTCTRCGVDFTQGTPRRSTCPKCTYLIMKERRLSDPERQARYERQARESYERCHVKKKEYERDRYRRNREKELKRASAYRLRNKAKISAYHAQWYRKNKKQVIARVNSWKKQRGELAMAAGKSQHVFQTLAALGSIKKYGSRKQN